MLGRIAADHGGKTAHATDPSGTTFRAGSRRTAVVPVLVAVLGFDDVGAEYNDEHGVLPEISRIRCPDSI